MLAQYICVDYPCYVENDEKAIRTLGGMERIEQTFQRRNRKLFLNFTPENLFAKLLCSNIIESSQPQLSHTGSESNTNKIDDCNEPNTNEFDSKNEVSWRLSIRWNSKS